MEEIWRNLCVQNGPQQSGKLFCVETVHYMKMEKLVTEPLSHLCTDSSFSSKMSWCCS